MGERGLSDSLDAGDDTCAAVALNASDIVAAYWKGRRQPIPRQKAPFPLRNQSSTRIFGFSQKSAFSTLANYFRSLLVIAHGDEGAMSQMPGICPFDKCDLTDEFRFNPAAFFHFLCG
jgi:hypothetical protein